MKAHAAMLAKQGIVLAEDAEAIAAGLDRIAAGYEASGVADHARREAVRFSDEFSRAT